MQEIFRLGFIPQEDNFLELTDEQYAQFHAKEGESDERIFMLVSNNPHIAIAEGENEISIVTESEKNYFASTAEIIKNYCKDQPFASDEEKLRYAASKLPDCFTKGTRYEKYHHLSILKKENVE